MPRLTADQWETVRAEREAGASFPELAARWGVSHQAIQKRAKAEGWGDGRDVGEIVRRKAASAEVIRRHQEETNAVRERLYAGLKAHKAALTKEDKVLAFEDLKAAKIASETIINIHRAERQAWGLDVDNNKPTVVIERSYGKAIE